ncbi:Ig-like domain-containing protein, partial [Staphylococcus lutrae]
MTNKDEVKLNLQRQQKFGIRKFKVGVASVMFASFFYMNMAHVAQAAESQKLEISTVERKTETKQPSNLKSLEEVKRRKEYDKDMTMNQTVGSPDSTNVQTNDTTFGIKVTNPLSQENKGAIKVQSNVAVAPEAHREERTAFRVAGTDSASTGTNEIQMPSQEPASQAHTQVITVKGVREKVYRKSIPVMNHPKKAQTLGMGRGTGQGRESLGLVIPANMKLYIRQSARHNEGDIRVSLVTDDSRQNRAVVVPKNGNWVNIHTSIDSGAFVYLPRGFRTQPQVDFYVENNQGMMLPTYHKGGDQALFEQQWRDTQASYAFVEGKYNAFLLPKIDRKRIEDMKKSKDANAFKTLDQMLNFYDDVIQKYNQWSGLTDDPNAIHYNVEQKYFTMADKHGAGIAYWSRDHMGSNQPSLRGYLQPGWLALHEVGHGFDGWMIGDGHMELVEIWNNIFANEYQTKVMGVKKDWLYQGKQTQYQKALQDKILKDPSHFTLGRTNVRERLDFLTRMVRLTTFNGVTDMLKAMREEAAKGHVEKDVPRWIIEHWLGDHGYNGLAYFGIYQIKLPKTLIDQANASRNAYVYPLAMLIDNAAERARYAKQLGLSSVYELVRSSDLKDTTIDSHATIHIHRNGQHLPEGAEVKLVDGTETVAIGTIQNDTVNFAHIRPGVYKVIAPLSQNYALPEHAYLIVRENGTNEVTLDYPDANSTQNAMTEHISLKGLANVEFASIDYYPLTKTVVYKQSPAKPHIYYNDEYAHVTIQNQQGEQLLERSFIGNRQSPSEVVTFKMEYGDTIQVKHREATSRRQVFRLENHAEIPMPNKKKETVTYRLTDKGLIVDNETQEAAESRYASQLQSDVNAIIETIKQNPGKDFRTQLYRVVQGVQHVNGREKERLLTQLQPYMEETTTLNTPEPTWTVTEYGRGFVGGNGPAHASIAVTFPSGTVVNTTVENNGEWTVNVPVNESFHPGDEIAAIATIQGKFSSQSVQAAVTDTIAPSPVVVNPFNEHDTVMSGETEPHTTVEVRLPNQQTLTTMSEDGHWSVQLPEGMDLTSNDRIDVIAVDGFKNRSMVNVVTPVDVTPPVKPTVATTESKQHIIWGTGEKYQDQIEVILPNNTVIKTKVGRNLTWMIGVPFDTELVVGDVIKVTEIDRFGNRSQSGTGDVVDTTPPSQPVVQHLLEGSSTLTGQAEPGSHIIVQLSSNQTLETETQADGTWQIDAPEISHITRDDEVSVIARDTSQNMSQETKVVVDPKSMPQSCPTTEESESAQTETLSKEKETSAQETNSKSSSKETATPKTDDQATSEASSQEGATEKVQTPENPLSTPETTDTGETQPEADRTSGTVDEHHGSDSSVMSSEISENTSSSPETNPETTNLDNATAEPPAPENSDTKSESPTGSEGSTSPEESQSASPSEEAVPVESTLTSEVSETGKDQPDVGETTNLDNATAE